jgi:hypothetical protein
MPPGSKFGNSPAPSAPQGTVYRPGIWLVLREGGPARGQATSAAARARVAAVAEDLRTRLGLF